MENKNTTPIMTSQGNGLELFEPPADIQSLTWKAPDTLKEAFLSKWNTYYTLEKEVGGNAGINQLSVLDEMQQLLEEGKLDVTKSCEELYNKVLDLVLERDILISDESQ